ncbi:hypothetical protein EGW08_004763 [Elysia chlorotica]|uniref:Uncharacterized protein n=1 Tax=Elysia chlorotica TaxID=188477 RepID=A0A3S0ZW53_ELYCH|nr:hypothetical protein EGW08_004763 [Elysia chlorotica]
MPVLTDSISIDQQEAAGHATDLTSTDAKVSSESLLFNKEIDDDGHQQIDAFTRQLLTALEISVIFEDLVDTMTAISNAVPAPVVEIRTAASIVEDEFFNRPRYGGFVKEVAQTVSKVPPTTPFTTGAAKPLLPPIVKRDSKSLGSPESKSKVSKDKQSGTGTTVSNKSRPMSTAGSQSESQTEFVGK